MKFYSNDIYHGVKMLFPKILQRFNDFHRIILILFGPNLFLSCFSVINHYVAYFYITRILKIIVSCDSVRFSGMKRIYYVLH